MQNNSVGDDGYGANIATPVSSFYATLLYENRTETSINAGDALRILNWRSGDSWPTLRVTVVDHFSQGPAVTKSTSAVAGIHSGDRLARYDDYAKATVRSPDGLISNPIVTDLSNGTGNFTAGSQFQRPGDYSAILWIGDDEATVIVFNLTIRDCIVNEESSRNGTLCALCDSNQFNFHPHDQQCSPCPDNTNCSSPYTLPLPGFWNAFPCSDKVRKCINEEACKGSDASEVLQMLDSHSTDCNFSEAFKQWYASSLCEDGYSAPLCGACTDSAGRVGIFTCAECDGNGAGVLLILTAMFVVTVLVILQIKGNLDTAEHWSCRQISQVIDHQTRRRNMRTLRRRTPALVSSETLQGFRPISRTATTEVHPTESAAFKQKESMAKWKFVELLKVEFCVLKCLSVACCRSQSIFSRQSVQVCH